MLMMSLQPSPNEAADRMIDIRGVAEIAGVSVRTIERLVEQEQFPKPTYIGSARRWWRSEVVAHLRGLGGSA